MDSPPALIEKAPETEADFRKWVREEFAHQREMQKHTNAALELILKALKVDEQNHEVSNGAASQVDDAR